MHDVNKIDKILHLFIKPFTILPLISDTKFLNSPEEYEAESE